MGFGNNIMNTIFDLITPKKERHQEGAILPEKENEIQSENIAVNVKTKKVNNLVRAPVSRSNLVREKPITRKPRNLIRPNNVSVSSRGRSAEKKPVIKKKQTHGYLRTTQSYLSKRYSKDVKEKSSFVRRKSSVTQPKSIKLHTKIRSRFSSRQPLSQKERDDLFMKNLKPFKAREINSKIMSSKGELGIPRVKTKPTTEIKAFNFRTTKRASSRAKSLSRQNSPNKQPFRRQTLQKQRKISQIRSKPMFRHSLERHKTSQQLLEEKRRKETEQLLRSRVFHAQPIPDFRKIEKFHKPQPKKTTIAMTPKTLIKSRLSGEMLKQRIEEEKAKVRASAEFHASGLPETTYTPEKIVHFEHKSATKGKTPLFKLEERAIDRQLFDEQVKEMKKRQEKIKLLIEKRKEQEEQQNLKEYRKSLIHRPLPMPETTFVICKEEVE